MAEDIKPPEETLVEVSENKIKSAVKAGLEQVSDYAQIQIIKAKIEALSDNAINLESQGALTEFIHKSLNSLENPAHSKHSEQGKIQQETLIAINTVLKRNNMEMINSLGAFSKEHLNVIIDALAETSKAPDFGTSLFTVLSAEIPEFNKPVFEENSALDNITSEFMKEWNKIHEQFNNYMNDSFRGTLDDKKAAQLTEQQPDPPPPHFPK